MLLMRSGRWREDWQIVSTYSRWVSVRFSMRSRSALFRMTAGGVLISCDTLEKKSVFQRFGAAEFPHYAVSSVRISFMARQSI